jgi:hypothetical protein
METQVHGVCLGNRIGPLVRIVKLANCLIKNLLESESLPQIRNLLEMSEINPAGVKPSGGVKNEANDERAETTGRGVRRSVSAGTEERKAGDSE